MVHFFLELILSVDLFLAFDLVHFFFALLLLTPLLFDCFVPFMDLHIPLVVCDPNFILFVQRPHPCHLASSFLLLFKLLSLLGKMLGFLPKFVLFMQHVNNVRASDLLNFFVNPSKSFHGQLLTILMHLL